MNHSDRFTLLNTHYAKKAGLYNKTQKFTHIQAPVKSMSYFNEANDMRMPLKVHGRLITSGRYYDEGVKGTIVMSPEELKKSLPGWQNIKLFKDHSVFQAIAEGKDIPIDSVVGKITTVVWNVADNAIDYYAEIYDQDVAYKILKGVINFVSVGFGRSLDEFQKNTFKVLNISPKEVSLVFNPKDKRASIQPVFA